MSVIEKAAPNRKVIVMIAGIAAVIATAIAVTLGVGSDSSPSTDRAVSPGAPSTTTRPSSNTTAATGASASPSRVSPIDAVFDIDASYRVYLQRTAAAGTVRVFAYIDPPEGELHYIDGDPVIYGSVVGRFADMLVLQSSMLRIIDRDFATAPVAINGDDFVGSWHDHAIVAEYFPERTSFHEYRVDGSEARSVGLVGRRPDVIGGIVRDSVVIERAGRLLLLGVADATVREFAVGHLLGVGGDHIFFTSCTTQGTCTLNDASLDGIHRTTPIGSYVDPQSGVVTARVAPDGTGVLVHAYAGTGDSLLERGTLVPLASGVALERYTWAPTGRLVFRVDEETRRLDALDTHSHGVIEIPLPSDDRISLQSVAVW